MSPVLRIVVGPGATLPEYKSQGAAGMDLCCSEEFELAAGARKLVKTGLRIAVPEGFEAQVRPRSGLALNKGIGLVNSPGTIDSDYRGEVGLILINHSNELVSFSAGERVAQLVICPVVQALIESVGDLDETTRGEGGFGSTGR